MAKTTEIPQGNYYEDMDKLILWEDNYNEGDVGLIIQLIKQYGFVGAIKVWKDNQVRGGNHSLMALRAIKAEKDAKAPANIKILNVNGNEHWLVPCAPLNHLNETQAIAFAIADNRSAAKASQNDEMLFEYLERLQSEDDTLVTGYDDDDYEMLRRLMATEPVTMDTPSEGVSEAFDTFMNSTIKQIVLYMDSKQFVETVERLSKIASAHGLENNTEVMLFLLNEYERTHDEHVDELTA